MASVTGRTVESIDELLDPLIKAIEIDEDGQLLYTKVDNSVGNAGTLSSPLEAVDLAWPVNSIFISVVPTNPSDLLGVGEWVRFGQGRVLVSQDGTQPEFDVAQETGGAKTVTLDATQIPSHAHSIAHTHPYTASYDTNDVETGTGSFRVTGVSLSHTRAADLNGTTGDSSAADSGAAGGGLPHNNLQPYIVVYMWKRNS